MNEAEIWRIANDMIHDYGADAEGYARSRAETLRKENIPDDALLWDSIAAAIAELGRKGPGSDDPVN